MSIQERMSDPLLLGQLNSLGGDLPQALLKAFQACNLVIDSSHIPAFRFETENIFMQIGHFATGHLLPGKNRKVLYVRPDVLAQHADELRVSLESRLKILPKNDAEQRRFEQYCLMQSMVHLVLQVVVDFNEADKKIVHDKFTDMNF